MADPAAIPDFDRTIRADPQMQLQAVNERKYYEDQAGPVAAGLTGLATFVAIVMGIGAVFGAMNTMYAIVAARTREIGTLRALGFSRRAVLFSFLIESVFLALVGRRHRRACWPCPNNGGRRAPVRPRASPSWPSPSRSRRRIDRGRPRLRRSSWG